MQTIATEDDFPITTIDSGSCVPRRDGKHGDADPCGFPVTAHSPQSARFGRVSEPHIG